MRKHQRNSILCPNCRRLISLDEQRCPYCGEARPGSILKNNIWTRGLKGPEQLIKSVIYLNVGMYIISLLFNPSASSLTMNPLTFLSPGSESLFILGATGTVPIDNFQYILRSIGATPIALDYLPRWWTLVSANYLHGGILHIFFNMVAFRQLAPLVIQEFGAYRTVIIYTVGGLIGFWISYLAGITLTIGASAAVCALIGASLYYGKSRGGDYGRSIYKQIGGWALGLFVFGLLVPGINNWGHGGGIAAGALLGFLLGYHDRSPERLIHKTLAGICAGLTVCILAWALFTGFYYRFI